MAAFVLHPQLRADCIALGRFELCRLLLLDDARWPWCILVPERAAIAEIHELGDADQVCLIRESSRLSARMAAVFAADKMNVAALGNQVPQLHVHHVARTRGDAAWPGVVWGCGQRQSCAPDQLHSRRERLLEALPELTPEPGEQAG